MRNAGLEEAQAGIKITRRNINNLRYADDTTLMAESEEELKSLLRNLYAGQEATVRTGHGTTELPNRKRSTSRLYSHPDYLTYRQSTS